MDVSREKPGRVAGDSVDVLYCVPGTYRATAGIWGLTRKYESDTASPRVRGESFDELPQKRWGRANMTGLEWE